jgi:hypothetical protein
LGESDFPVDLNIRLLGIYVSGFARRTLSVEKEISHPLVDCNVIKAYSPERFFFNSLTVAVYGEDSVDDCDLNTWLRYSAHSGGGGCESKQLKLHMIGGSSGVN